jgi:hypothetical protein
MESRKEIILGIAKRAGFVVDISGHSDRNADLHYTLDRFAELIVRECIGLLPEDCQSDNGRHASWTIKEHFGVEE